MALAASSAESSVTEFAGLATAHLVRIRVDLGCAFEVGNISETSLVCSSWDQTTAFAAIIDPPNSFIIYTIKMGSLHHSPVSSKQTLITVSSEVEANLALCRHHGCCAWSEWGFDS